MRIKNKNPKTDWSVGDKVYMFMPYAEPPVPVAGHITNISGDAYHVSSLCYNGDRTVDELFVSVDDAIQAADENAAELTEKYKTEIKTVEDLLRFALRVPVAPCEEYTNESASMAFKEKAFELLGIKL